MREGGGSAVGRREVERREAERVAIIARLEGGGVCVEQHPSAKIASCTQPRAPIFVPHTPQASEEFYLMHAWAIKRHEASAAALPTAYCEPRRRKLTSGAATALERASLQLKNFIDVCRETSVSVEPDAQP